MGQFADFAVEHDDLANYLGFAEDVFFNVSRKGRRSACGELTSSDL